MTATPKYNFEEEFQDYLCKLLYLKKEEFKYDESIIEYFGVVSLDDPDRKLWYLYYCNKSELDKTLDRLRSKYGKKKVMEIFCEPIFNGVDLCVSLKKHFAELKWRTKGNIIEAPPNSRYTDERLLKVVNELYNKERQKLFNFLNVKHDCYKTFH